MKNNARIKFNAMDLTIILVIIAAVVAIGFRSGLKNSLVALRSNEIITYTVKITNVQEASFDKIYIGDELYHDSDDKLLGTIVEKSSRPAEAYISLNDGSITKTYIPDRIDLFLTVECKGRKTDEGCMLGGSYFVAAGKRISAYTDKLSFNLEVTDAYNKQIATN